MSEFLLVVCEAKNSSHINTKTFLAPFIHHKYTAVYQRPSNMCNCKRMNEENPGFIKPKFK